MTIDTSEFAAIRCQVAEQAQQIHHLAAQYDALTEAIRLSYSFARRPMPEGLRLRARDRHGLHVVRDPRGGAA